MRNLTLLGSRLVLGSYLAAHGAQKLFGSFDGPGIEGTSTGFEYLGLTPGKQMATLASSSEIVGGLLIATGIADPLGPLMIMGTMAVASTTHRANGPFTAKGGFELPLTNLAAAGALAVAGTGCFRLGPRAPKWLIRLAAVGGALMAGYSIRQLLAKQPEAAPAGAAEEDSTGVAPSSVETGVGSPAVDSSTTPSAGDASLARL